MAASPGKNGQDWSPADRSGRSREAVAMFRRAETLAPAVADYPYARTIVLWRLGDRVGAEEAARRALQIDPAYAPARQMLQAK